MFSVILNKTKRDRQLPDRAYTLGIYQKVLDGTLYNCFTRRYDEEYVGGVMNPTYIEEKDRAPCINTGLNLMRSVVEESVSFLFGEDRFPNVLCDDEESLQFIKDITVDTHLVNLFQEAALKGSIGSVAIQLRVLNDRFFPLVHSTVYLTPTFDPEAPDTLIKLVEKKKVLGADLAAAGYDIEPGDMQSWFWFQRIWDENIEQWYLPWNVLQKNDFVPQIDTKRSVEHRLGIVPWHWIKNLPSSGNDIDGQCTFEPALENAVQIDYALSRADRALKYNADPLMIIKVRNPSSVPDFCKSSGNALTVPVEGDAKMLEITGDAAHAILDTIKELKDEALHAIHGNRANPDKLATSQSSVAQRMLYIPMVQLASSLRLSYGDGGIVPLLRMMMRIASKMPVKVRGKLTRVKNPEVPLDLVWYDFFPPTPADMQTESATILALVTNGLMSKKEGLRQLNKFFGYTDMDAELAEIEKDQDDLLQRQLKLAQAGQKPQSGPTSSSGNTIKQT